MAGPRRRSRQPGQPGAGPLGADIGSFRLHLAAEGKAARTVQGYTSAVRWFAVGYLLGQAGKTSWEQVDARDIRQWMTWLLDRYSGAYASIQFRALRQFFKWRADEDESPDPMARLRAPQVTLTAVPVFTSVELSELGRACQGRSFAARRGAAIIAVFTATGIRLSELAGIRCHPGDPARSDLDLQGREIRIRGKGGTARTVKIGHQAARSLDSCLRARARPRPRSHAMASPAFGTFTAHDRNHTRWRQPPNKALSGTFLMATDHRIRPATASRPKRRPSRRVSYHTELNPRLVARPADLARPKAGSAPMATHAQIGRFCRAPGPRLAVHPAPRACTARPGRRPAAQPRIPRSLRS